MTAGKSTRQMVAEAVHRVLYDPSLSKSAMRAAGRDITQGPRPLSHVQEGGDRMLGEWSLEARTRYIFGK